MRETRERIEQLERELLRAEALIVRVTSACREALPNSTTREVVANAWRAIYLCEKWEYDRRCSRMLPAPRAPETDHE